MLSLKLFVAISRSIRCLWSGHSWLSHWLHTLHCLPNSVSRVCRRAEICYTHGEYASPCIVVYKDLTSPGQEEGTSSITDRYYKMISTIPKILLLSLSLSAGSLAAVQGTFTRYFQAECAGSPSTASIFEGYCVNISDFPILSFDAVVTSGACEDATTSPVLSVFSDPGCETGLLTSVDVGSEAECTPVDANVQSLFFECA
ncbi:hypothetical protein BJX99DRAFT_163608 [Aspergillus californicus]